MADKEKNINEFDSALSVLKVVLRGIGSNIDNTAYDGILIKKIAATNTLDRNGSSKQTHIAITGSQMDMFPYMCADGYFNVTYEDADQILKKYFTCQVPAFIHKENFDYLGGDFNLIKQKEECVNISVIKSRRNNQEPQIQLSIIKLDSPKFLDFRKLLHVGSYLIILKREEKLEYDLYGVKAENISVGNISLESYNNGFFKLEKITPVRIGELDWDDENGDLKIHRGEIESPEPDCPRNRIISGAPGTGKSYSLEEDRKEYFGRENLYNRVTFHPAYSYAQFFGCFKPISKMKNGEKEIEYSFVPGPFVTTLLKALAEPEKNFLLIIEEINRANVAAVFGDVFQLLDRDDSGKSEYAISISDELMEYINDGFGKELLNDVDVKEQKIRIPANMYIWATMNSADQGVMPMDTAFKRRWDFEYIGIDDGEEFIKDVNVRIQLKDGMQEFNWNELRKQINENLKVHGDEIPEDKLIGPFFIQKYILDMVEQDAGASEAFVKAFKNKVLMYLFDDVARYNLDYVFDTESIPGTAGLSDILAAFDEKGVNIIAGFTADIIPNDEDAEGENLEEEVEPTADGV